MEITYTRKLFGSEIDTANRAIIRVAIPRKLTDESGRIFTTVIPVSSHAGKYERTTSPATGLPVDILFDSEHWWDIVLLK